MESKKCRLEISSMMGTAKDETMTRNYGSYTTGDCESRHYYHKEV